jgi:transcriptional regulator with XRE-family HTH domain
MTYLKIGSRFKRLRKRSGMSLKAVAKKSKVDYRTIHRFENGHEIAATTFLKLVAFLEKQSSK